MRSCFALAALISLFAGTAHAGDAALGTWLTQPDRKQQVGHVVIRMCGQNLCGKVTQAFDKAGNPVVTRSVGKELFWNMKIKSPGVYGGGRVWVPLFNKEYEAKMYLQGPNKLKVEACLKSLCDGQVWTRIR